MMDTDTSLWPADLYIRPAQPPPVTILRAQATLLGQQTQNLIEGEVVTRDIGDGRMVHAFEVRAMALNGYTYTLFYIEQGINLYPVTIHRSFAAAKAQAAPIASAISDDELKVCLRELFASEETRRTLGDMIAQSQ